MSSPMQTFTRGSVTPIARPHAYRLRSATLPCQSIFNNKTDMSLANSLPAPCKTIQPTPPIQASCAIPNHHYFPGIKPPDLKLSRQMCPSLKHTIPAFYYAIPLTASLHNTCSLSPCKQHRCKRPVLVIGMYPHSEHESNHCNRQNHGLSGQTIHLLC